MKIETIDIILIDQHHSPIDYFYKYKILVECKINCVELISYSKSLLNKENILSNIFKNIDINEILVTNLQGLS